MKKYIEENDIVIDKDDLINVLQDDARTERMDDAEFEGMIDDIAGDLKFDLKKVLKDFIDDWMDTWEEL